MKNNQIPTNSIGYQVLKTEIFRDQYLCLLTRAEQFPNVIDAIYFLTSIVQFSR